MNIIKSIGPSENATHLDAPFNVPGREVFNAVNFPVVFKGVAFRANRLSQMEITPSCEATANMLDVGLKAVEKEESSEPVKVAWW